MKAEPLFALITANSVFLPRYWFTFALFLGPVLVYLCSLLFVYTVASVYHFTGL